MNYDFNHNLVKGCSLCDIFLEPEKNIHTKLYYPTLEEINKVDFIILDCHTCNIPMIVLRDHVSHVSREIWGKMLYQCKQIISGNIQLRCKPRLILDHYHCHIVKRKSDY